MPNKSELESFLTRLRRYHAGKLANTGATTLWQLSAGESAGFSENHAGLLKNIGPHVIALALTKADLFGNRTITPEHFLHLCSLYIDLPEAIFDPEFRDWEATAIANALAEPDHADPFPPEFIDMGSLKRLTGIDLWGVRAANNQLREARVGMSQLLRAWIVLKSADAAFGGAVSDLCEKIFHLKPLESFRAGLALYALAASSNGGGYFNLTGPTPDEFQREYGFDLAAVEWFAMRIGFDLNDLPAWLNQKVLAASWAYQKHVDDPLTIHGLFFTRSVKPAHFLVPAPGLFLRALPSFVLDTLGANFSSDNLQSKFGDHLEKHIAETLAGIFGDCFEKLPERHGGSADFLIRLGKVDVVIELKKGGSRGIYASLTPSGTAGLFRTLHKAARQLAASRRLLRELSDRPVCSIILVAEGAAIETLAYIAYARDVGIQQHLGLESLEGTSWASLEHMLSEVTLEGFKNGLAHRISVPVDISALDSMPYRRAGPEQALHRFEHLAAARSEVWGFIESRAAIGF